MPYLLISAQVVLEKGPTTCGDVDAPKDVMEALGATLIKQRGNNFYEYVSPLAPRLVLNTLETLGYTVVSQSGPGQTVVWTLFKPSSASTNSRS